MRIAVAGLVLSGAVCIFVVSGGSAAPQSPSQSRSDAVRQVQVLEEDATGVSAPVGIAFSPQSGAFYVLGGPGGSVTDVTKLTPFDLAPTANLPSPARIAAAVQDPINVAFDPFGNRLLLLSNARELIEVRAGSRGDLGQSLNRSNAAQLALRNPQGMTVDPSTGTIYILDAGSSSIVRVESSFGGSFQAATSSVIDLRPTGLLDVRGLAYDASSGHLLLGSGKTLVELTTSGKIVATRDLSGLELGKREGMVFAPSGDLTDSPSETSVYLADSGAGTGAGQILELSLAPQATSVSIDFTSQLVRTVNMAALSPPSPDPSGIAYVPTTDRLVIVDGEVEETVNRISHFQGANVWELNRNGLSLNRTANISTRSPTQVPMTNEPTGVAFNPSNGHYYVSDDNTKRVYDLNPGSDGLIGTSNDTWTYFSTQGVGNNDPEGVAYKESTGRIYVADGVNREIYEYTTGGNLLSQFDTARYGVDDPETVEVSTSGTLFVLSNRQSGPIIIETSTGGSLIQTIDVSAAGARKPAGLAYANASNGSGSKRFYFVDRGVDNNSDPRELDGKLYEMTTPGSSPPPPPPPGGGGQLDIRVNASADDAEEVAGTGLVQRGDGDLDMMTDVNDTKLVVGTRFTGVAIPRGASITNAYLQFTADEVFSVSTSLTIRGHAADNATAFSTNTFDLSSRPTTAASASWSPAAWLAVGDAGLAQRSSNLAAIIQELVNRAGWASGNAVVLLVRGSGRRVAVAHNKNPAAAPLLHVEWTS